MEERMRMKMMMKKGMMWAKWMTMVNKDGREKMTW